MNKKEILPYSKLFFKRLYRPIKPAINPLLKRVKARQVLVIGLSLVIAGCFFNGWQVKAHERAAWWPWSSRVHSEMSLAWFEAGEEKESLRELEMANNWQLRFNGANEVFEVAKNRVSEPEQIREEIAEWNSFLSNVLYYRDGWLKLAELEYRQYNNEKAKENLSMGKYLDPIGENVLRVEDYIKN